VRLAAHVQAGNDVAIEMSGTYKLPADVTCERCVLQVPPSPGTEQPTGRAAQASLISIVLHDKTIDV